MYNVIDKANYYVLSSYRLDSTIEYYTWTNAYLCTDDLDEHLVVDLVPMVEYHHLAGTVQD